MLSSKLQDLYIDIYIGEMEIMKPFLCVSMLKKANCILDNHWYRKILNSSRENSLQKNLII